MSVKTGIDIIEINRVKESIESTEGEFCKKVFTQKEIEYCESKKAQKYQHYSARFAAKEAVFKAISEELENKYDITWQDIETTNDAQGRPYVTILNKDIQNIQNIDISISHCKEYAVVSVVVEIQDK